MTISTREFKGQVGKKFRDSLKPLGFKGSGTDLYKETDNFFCSIFLSPSRFGDKFTLGLAIHPKGVKKNSLGSIDFKRFKNSMFEYKITPWKHARGQWWDYKLTEAGNLKTLDKVLLVVEEKVIFIISRFENTPGLLETIKPHDLVNFHSWFTKQTGATIATTDTRFAWSLALLFEKTDKRRARLFAKYCIDTSDSEIEFFGEKDLRRILS